MLITLFVVIVSVFLIICAWSAFDIYLDKRKQANQSLNVIAQSTDDHQ
ncbi:MULTISPECIES: hypothetical protein [Acinetobacter]|nr:MULTISPECIES: hypothetical protein [Acinetobacter]